MSQAVISNQRVKDENKRVSTLDLVQGFYALENAQAVGERIQKLFSHGRRFTVIQRFTSLDRADNLDIYHDLQLDDEAVGDGVELTSSTSAAGFMIWGQPGIVRVGGSTTTVTPAAARDIYLQKGGHGRSVLGFRLTGLGNEPQRDDRIELDHWNMYGVQELTTIVFQAVAKKK